MKENTAPIRDEEEAFKALDLEEEKEHFKTILDIDMQTDGYVCTKRPKLSVSYYVYKYKENGIPFSEYLEEIKDEYSLLMNEIVVNRDNIGVVKKQGFRAINERRRKELVEETRRGRKRNVRYAIILLVIVFLMICAFMFK